MSSALRHIRRASAILLVIGAGSAFFYFREDFLPRTISLFVMIFAAFVVSPRQKTSFLSIKNREKQEALAIRPWHWLVGVVLTILTAASFVWLYQDQQAGGKELLPLYVFVVSVLLCGFWWAGLYARWVEIRS